MLASGAAMVVSLGGVVEAAHAAAGAIETAEEAASNPLIQSMTSVLFLFKPNLSTERSTQWLWLLNQRTLYSLILILVMKKYTMAMDFLISEHYFQIRYCWSIRVYLVLTIVKVRR